MADDADSKSVVGNHVWVQVPPPALNLFQKALELQGLFCFINIDGVKKGQKLSQT